MAKPKRRELLSWAANEKNGPGGMEVDMLDEGGWIMVKKQKVTILIPPLPVIEQPMVPNSGGDHLEATAKEVTDTQSHPEEIHTQMLSACAGDRSLSLAPDRSIPAAKVVAPRSSLTFPKQLKPTDGLSSEPAQRHHFGGFKVIGVCNSSRVSGQTMIVSDKYSMLNGRMRALHLEKKLRKAGGLSSWLVSIGLDCFVKFFQGKNISKFQLANLTMKKLKDMGASAVGPRRKLMHAIDCLCQPYCFEHI